METNPERSEGYTVDFSPKFFFLYISYWPISKYIEGEKKVEAKEKICSNFYLSRKIETKELDTKKREGDKMEGQSRIVCNLLLSGCNAWTISLLRIETLDTMR